MGSGAVTQIADAWTSCTAGAPPTPPCTGLALTEAWSAYGAYRHYWTPMLRTGFAVGYTEIDQPGVANLNGIPDAKLFQGFISTIWSPVAGLDLSLDLVYSKVKTGNCTPSANPGDRNRSDMQRQRRRHYRVDPYPPELLIRYG